MGQNNKRETLEELRNGRDTASAAFMQFTNYKNYFPDHIFAFYEGEDGKYYNSRIKKIANRDLIHIKANSKSKVLEVMKMIQGKHEYDSVTTMYFVDRDMDFELEEYKNDNLYITPCYSIENLYVRSEAFGQILEDEFGLNVQDPDYHKCFSLFLRYYEEFCGLMTEFNALVLIRNEKGLNCGKVNIQKIKTMTRLINFDIMSGLRYSIHYQGEIDKLKEKLNVTDKDVEEAKIRLAKYGEPGEVFRGHNQLDFFATFIYKLSENKNSLFNPVPTSVNLNPNQNPLGDLSRYAITPPDLIDFIKKHCFNETQAVLC